MVPARGGAEGFAIEPEPDTCQSTRVVWTPRITMLHTISATTFAYDGGRCFIGARKGWGEASGRGEFSQAHQSKWVRRSTRYTSPVGCSSKFHSSSLKSFSR